MTKPPDFSEYCEAACRKLWGEPDKRSKKELRWNGHDAYSARTYSIRKHAWYDHGAQRGGSTLELVAYHKGLPKKNLRGTAFLDEWREANAMGIVPDPAPPLPEFEPKKKASGSSGKTKKGNSAAKSWSPTVARYVYRLADGTPYLQVCRTAAKGFFQNKWNGQMWVAGKPDGPKIPYRLPELLAAPLTAKVHIAEGEKDTDALAKLGFTATTNSEGAANWSDDLNRYFRDRHVCIHEDNDEDGRKRAQRIARALEPIAASVRVIRLAGLKEHGDVSDWLARDPSGARLVKECERTPVWEPSTTPPPEEEKEETDPEPKKKQADVLIELASTAELFHDRDDVGYGRFDVNGHKENWPIRSKGLSAGWSAGSMRAPKARRVPRRCRRRSACWRLGHNSMHRNTKSTSALQVMMTASTSISPIGTGARSRSMKMAGE